jgi:diaminopimelate decarboxylase
MNLTFAGVDTVRLAKQVGLPFHLYDGGRIAQNVQAFQKVFKESGLNGEVCFASKACGLLEILKIVAFDGAGVDVASEFEMKLALMAGVTPDKIVAHGNAKSDIYLEQAIRADALIVANHQSELELIESEAKRQQKKVRLLFRLSGFDLDPVTAAGIFTAGTWCKFGEPIDKVGPVLKGLKRWPHLDLIGFHVHIGSQITEIKPYLLVAGKLVDLALHYQEVLRRPVQVLNLGGGFPVSYVDKRTWNLLLSALKKQIRHDKGRGVAWEGMTGGFKRDAKTGRWNFSYWCGEKFYAAQAKEHLLAKLLKGKISFQGKEVSFREAIRRIGNPTLMVEPGRAIVGDAGITLARVAGVRTVADRHSLVTVELGIVNHGTGLVEPDLYTWTLANDRQRRDQRPFKAFVAGQLCFSGDMLSKYPVSFPRKPVRGDLAVIEKTGAYASTFFASTANGFPLPEIILISANGKVKKIRRLRARSFVK